ncbi:MAG: ABC transporter ATP-binding protein [Geobacteraceae bacterium]|nr:ABC transporter ATP-binding protein [Geobacteraceae bacterium]
MCLSVTRGEVFGFLGPNGAGKSTTIKTIMGLIKPSSGSVTVCGYSVPDSAARLATGYLPENPSFFDFLTGRELLQFIGREFKMTDTALADAIPRLLAQFALESAADRQIRNYSKGMVQRLGLAQALLHDPELYILDEPMSGLDPLGRAMVKDVIRDLKVKGKTVFFSTHVTADVEAVCDRVGVIVSGKLLAVEKVDQLLRKGIEGYDILIAGTLNWPEGHYWQPAATSTPDGWFIPAEHLENFLLIATSQGVAVTSVEPRRKDLEKFFLEIVTQGVQ